MKIFLAILSLLWAVTTFGQCTSGSSPNWNWTLTSTPSTLQTCINGASPGDTINISAGSAAWTTGVSISTNLKIQGAGSGRIVAYDDGVELLTIAAGTLNVNVAGFSPGFSGSVFVNGMTVQVIRDNFGLQWMQGTVTCYNTSPCSAGQLRVNVTSTNGTATNVHQWLIATMPQTTITNNDTSTALFNLTESAAGDINVSGIKFAFGTGAYAAFSLHYATNGKPILLHDNWIQIGTSGGLNVINSTTDRGVIWNTSFQGSTSNNGQLVTQGAFTLKIDTPATGQDAWQTQSYWGTADTTGTNNFYVETNDFHALQAATDLDDNARTVFRYNLMDTATVGTHGADTSFFGQRHFEFYNNIGVIHRYSDGTTMNLPNGWIGLLRGGTLVAHDNTMPALTGGTDYQPGSDILATVMNLNRNAGANPCWGYNTTGGALYHAPRQVGMGRVTGMGTDGTGRTIDTPPVGNPYHGLSTYVGDSEPMYIWSNSRSPWTISITNYSGPSNVCTGGTPDVGSNYIQSGRDYFNGSTPKPGYTPYTYPHPLTQSAPTPQISFSPQPLNFGQTPAGMTSNLLPLTIANTGTANLTVTSINSPGAFPFEAGGTCSPTPFTLAPGASCTEMIAFTPGSVGAFNQINTTTDNTSTSPSPISVTGIGTGPAAPGNSLFAGSLPSGKVAR